MSRNLTRSLLLMPLLAAGCATAATPSANPQEGGSRAVRFSDVSSREVVVQLEEAAYTAVIDLRPGTASPARWLTPGTRHLPAGPHTVALEQRAPRTWDRARRACNRPGESVSYSATMAQEAAPTDVREVNLGSTRVFCIRSGNAVASGERAVFVVVSPQPVSDGLLEEVLAEFNREHGRVPANAAVLSRALAEMLAVDWPGSTGYHIRVPPG
jgi:hypothetical protein